MQPLQYDLRDPAAKDNSITNAATARSNLDAAITMRSAETELQNTIELRATASEIVAPKPGGSRRQREKKTILRKSADKSLSQPSCSHSNTIYESPAAKDNSITHAAKAGSNLDAAIAIRSAKTELQTAIPFTLRERSYSCKAEWNSIGNFIHQHHLQCHLHCGNDPTVAKHNEIPSATHPPAPLAIPFTLRERSYSCKSQWNSVDRTCTKNR